MMSHHDCLGKFPILFVCYSHLSSVNHAWVANQPGRAVGFRWLPTVKTGSDIFSLIMPMHVASMFPNCGINFD